MKNFVIYTDGGCYPNPGLGACSFVVLEDGNKKVHEQAFKKDKATNNTMELSAIIAALRWVKENHLDVRVYVNTDSQYVQLGMTQWMSTWKRKGWKNANKKPVANQDLWKMLDQLSNQLDVHFQWVKGHAGNKWNDRADALCTAMINKYKK